MVGKFRTTSIQTDKRFEVDVEKAMKNKQFAPASTPLLLGINLIEASAGTGKTYAIAMLALRLVVELEFDIEQLLIVTFTRAATEELKDRIRRRFSEARRLLTESVGSTSDETLADWREALTIEPEVARKRLDLALLNIDRASIFTIHGFCQRVLKEHALESGQLFDIELTGELSTIKQACADDFWRRQLYRRSRRDVSILTAAYQTPDLLLASVDPIPLGIDVYPETIDLDDALNQLNRAADLALPHLEMTLVRVKAGIATGKFNRAFVDLFESLADGFGHWLHGLSDAVPSADAFALFSHAAILEALNGQQFRSAKGRSSEQRKLDFLTELAIESTPFDALNKAFANIAVAMRRNLLATLQREIDRRLQQLNVLSFDDLITRLSKALHGASGERLAIELRQRFRAVLIDEFQDTDASQWHIFSTLFAISGHYLYLIGDPKQAIYKFRGADIYAYLSAQAQAQRRYTLTHNWRSHPQLVRAVNALFRKDRVFRLEAVDFHPVQSGRKVADGAIAGRNQSPAPMVLWQLPQSASKTGYWTAGKAASQISLSVVNEIVELLTQNLSVLPEGRPLQAKDLAILVRTNTQAREYQRLLLAAGVPVVINSNESVFSTQEALDLHIVLQAVAHSGDVALLKQALTLNWFGLDGRVLYRLGIDENLFDPWLSRFAGYYQLWRQQGLMAMMQKLLAVERVRTHLARTRMVERQLTNLNHVLELTQQAALDNYLGIEKTLDWLRSEITGGGQANGIEECQLRLESDENAVQVITQHRAKGLEFPVVFCPCLWQCSNRPARNNSHVQCHEQGRMVVDLGSEQYERRKEQASFEERAEDVRIAYVALTRAKYRCYVAWADVRSEDKHNDSAFSWLLDLGEQGFAEQQATLQFLAKSDPEVFAYRLLELTDRLARIDRAPFEADALSVRLIRRNFYSSWQMSSYTALSALSQHAEPELPLDKTGESQFGDNPSPAILPRGAPTGNVVHELLELNDFSDLATGKDIGGQRDQLCRRYGVNLERPEAVDELLREVVSTPLSTDDSEFCLRYLDDRRCLKEMPFYLSMKATDTGQINEILAGLPVFQTLNNKALSGYLTGFIDLICEYRGRYYVMDYKTNDLPDYSPESLTSAMREHNYGLQYWLYAVVLHRYLQQRLTGYRFERHFGGVCYLFVRGMHSYNPGGSIYVDRPGFEKVRALTELFET